MPPLWRAFWTMNALDLLDYVIFFGVLSAVVAL